MIAIASAIAAMDPGLLDLARDGVLSMPSIASDMQGV